MTTTNTPRDTDSPGDTGSPRDTATRAAFEAHLRAHRGIVARVAGTYAWQRDDREDLAQEIATQLWRAWPAYDAERPFSTWMYRIALNVAISYVRKHRGGLPSKPTVEAQHELADPRPHDHEVRQQVDLLFRFIQSQPPLDRALLLLYLEDRNYREMADVLGISVTNVATKISRLKQRIRQEL